MINRRSQGLVSSRAPVRGNTNNRETNNTGNTAPKQQQHPSAHPSAPGEESGALGISYKSRLVWRHLHLDGDLGGRRGRSVICAVEWTRRGVAQSGA